MELRLYAYAVGKHWWALMSCAAFTFIGFYVAYAGKSNEWTVRAIFCFAMVFLFIAGFLAWRDEYHKLIKTQAEQNDLRTQILQLNEAHGRLAPPVEIHISDRSLLAEPPHLGMRIVYLSTPLLRGGETGLDVEFRLRLLSGRPATSVSIEPVYSKSGIHSIHFADPQNLIPGEEQVVSFEVWKGGTRPSSKQLALTSGWGNALAEFVWASRIEEGIVTSPLIIHFRDRSQFLEQRFKFTYNSDTRTLGLIDEYLDSEMGL